ncbi:MAG: nucleotidyltransferase [Deltaproteobacteria bacterium]|nr:nucleotidyltransferase [Deltaproteobacteria bacterium]
MPFPNEWSEFIGLLSSHRVRFLVVGAHALAVIGRVRATKDLDLLVEPTRANAKRVCAALAEFGFRTLAEELEAFATPDRMATLGREPLRIDVMTSISGVSFATAWRGRVTISLAGHEVSVIGREEFLRNKRASARPKDLADIALVEELRAAPPPKLQTERPPRRR